MFGKTCWDGFTRLIQWSDGPKQFKSALVLAAAVRNLDLRRQLQQIDLNFGFPKHFKGAHDGWIGTLKHVFEEHLKTLKDNESIQTVKEVVDITSKWAETYMLQHPGGPVLHVVEFMPPLKIAASSVTTTSIRGLQQSFAFQFERRSKRRLHLLGRGVEANTYSGVTFRNLGLTGLACVDGKEGFLERAAVDDADESDHDSHDEETKVLELHTQSYNGWRISYTKDNSQLSKKRRLHLHRCFIRQSPLSLNLPAGLRHRPEAERVLSAKRTMENNRQRQSEARKWHKPRPPVEEAKAAAPEALDLRLPPIRPVQIGGASSSTD